MALPTGTVTLLFSDIEGSTRLLNRLGGRYAAALELQRTILRQAWADFGGTELGTEGDSFFVAFPDAPSAVSAAVQAQRGVAEAEWPEGERVKVRIGIHTGSPVAYDDGYVGMDVHRAARIAASAYGGQVLVSDATAVLAQAAGVEFRDLGRHSLKDLPQPEHLFQVVAPGLAEEFPSVRGLGSTAGLPTPSTPLIGRDEALAELTELLGRPHVRLVTLTGPGGTGKTRLAVAVAGATAERYTQGAFFVPLESVTSADVMWTTVATALGVPPEGRMPPGLFDHLAQRSALLVLDNLEQVRDADTVVHELLQAAPGIRVLATSRLPLHVSGEQEYPLPPLAVPDAEGEDAAESAAAVQLLVSAARLVRPSFALTPENRHAVVELCRRLDGLPLALELVAARLKLLTPQALLGRLDQALDLRSPDATRPDRQRTLRQTIAWSHDLLEPVEQRMFRCLGVFAGDADLAAIEAVWNAVDDSGTDPLDLVERLVDASLVVVRDGARDEPRLGMLNMVAAYAAELLAESGDEATAREAAVRHFDDLMQRLEEDRSPRWRERLTATLEEERQNYRACLSWLLDHLDGPDRDERLRTMLQMTFGFSWWFLTIRGYFAEAHGWLEQAVAAAGDRRGLRTAVCLAHLAMSEMTIGRIEEGVAHAEQANQLVDPEEVDPEDVDADLPPHEAADMRFIVENSLVQRYDAVEDYERALAMTTALLERTEDPLFRAVALMNIARYHDLFGDSEAGLPLLEEAAALAEAAGDELIELDARYSTAATQRLLGRPDQAEREFRELFAPMLALRIPLSELTFAEDYAAVLAELDRPADSALLFGAAAAMRERLGVPREKAQEQELAGPTASAKAALGEDGWAARFAEGHGMTVERAVRQLL